MALLNRFITILCSSVIFATFASAKTVTYDFNVTWVMANPDGLRERPVVGINGKWPLPVIEVNKGDRLVVNMHNGLGDMKATIHFHGMYQNGSNWMDGPSMVTQCPVPPGYDFTYNFTVNQNGTYWYHCHVDFCYPDGYRQAFIIHDQDAYFYNDYDEDLIVTMSDWYHELSSEIEPSFLSLYNPTGAEPLPKSFLFNDTQNTSIPVEPNKTYLMRLINIGAFVGQYFYIDGHELTIVEIDGVYTEPTKADVLYIAVAQRYAVLVTTKSSTDQNYPIVTVADSVLLDVIPSDLKLNNTNWLQYDKAAPHPQAVMRVPTSSDLDPFDDMKLVPYDHMPLLTSPDHIITVSVGFEDLDNGISYAFLNNLSYTNPLVPTLYTVMSSGDLATNEIIYGEFTHSAVLKHNDVVEIVLNNLDTGTHPFHLHGHNFQMINRAPEYGPNFYSYLNGDPVPYNPANHTPFPATPARRDTFVLPPQGYWVARFVADNPGVWFFHCHIDWHLSQGLGMLMVEAPDKLQAERSGIPQQHYDVCKAAGVEYKGNAAGNTKDFLDLQGQDEQPAWLPAGFTPRGIVALVFSCFNALLGLAAITLYGLFEPKVKKNTAEVDYEVTAVPVVIASEKGEKSSAGSDVDGTEKGQSAFDIERPEGSGSDM